MMQPSRLLIPVLILTAASCTYISQGFFSGDERGGIAEPSDYFGDSAERIVYPEQNWDNADSLWFYTITQGSNLMPFQLFLHLEQAGSTQLFRHDDNMRRLRYLPQHPTRDNQHGLPVGWVKDHYQGEDYIGLTCAACHTAQINYQGVGIRIDGGPAMADMETMLHELEAALAASLADEIKFARLTEAMGAENKAQVHQQLAEAHRDIATYNRDNRSVNNDTHVAYGYARLDAFGRIYNRLLAHLTPGETNANPPNAPVSYPFLWDTPHHDFVQWNGVADNIGAGPLGRNTGEVLGVFASMDLNQHSGDLGFVASADIRNLARIERHLQRLWSPQWQELAERDILPAIDEDLAREGREVYQRYQCHTCHAIIDRSDKNRRVIAQMASLEHIGTDTQMAHNAYHYSGRSGYFEGELIDPVKLDGQRFGPTTKVLPALSLATAGVILEPDPDKIFIRRWIENGYDLLASLAENPILYTRKHLDFAAVKKSDPDTLLAYKGRPLNGIWATAPYLHNGSVATLYELFLPYCAPASYVEGACRRHQFTVGTREFDPVHVGFIDSEHADLFVFDTRLPGNSNKGHEYAAGNTPVFTLDARGRVVKDRFDQPITAYLPPISDHERMALIEYLKTL